MSGRPRLVYYVSGHGYGHATRAALVLESLRAVLPAETFVRTSAAARFFAGTGAALSAGEEEPPPVQRGGLDVDWEASLGAQLAALERRDAAVSREAAWLASVGPALVLSDAPSLACEAAAKAGVACRLVSNFTWDWVYGRRALIDPRWSRVSARMARAYAGAAGAWRLPGAGGFETVSGVEDAGLVARRSPLPRAEARARLGVPADGRPLVLVSFGGYGAALPPLSDPGLAAFHFAGFGPRPAGLSASWVALDANPARPHAESVAACDVLLCKPGYGTFAEGAAHGAAIVYVDRPDYAEAGALVSWLRRAAACRELPRADFEAGRWARALGEAAALPAAAAHACDGAEGIARRLRDLLRGAPGAARP